jgi:hypothetical protein
VTHRTGLLGDDRIEARNVAWPRCGDRAVPEGRPLYDGLWHGRFWVVLFFGSQCVHTR